MWAVSSAQMRFLMIQFFTKTKALVQAGEERARDKL